ncbi:DUF3048 domain-containing protein [Oceanobacillus sp. 143]|uniref:DUF3048 domain-containing protein n=1 Tax=Oceanobacillus zhaokaii TaxID=2052660 RepID=A0A345PDW9_9BACI|nr:DUF3048 domain-containing protein [Oceanobacillus zhaokaii]AXI08199.1 DUF3048 domain-containing protein [Oceanobacillus zhaokaii]QGS68137.1 DUF3048 domain-containing protein [Oceanobacillus sp. 143]
MRKYLAIVLLLCCLLVACNNGEKQGKSDVEKDHSKNGQDSTEQVESPLPEDSANLYPLSGISTDEAVNQRIVGVMVNNHQSARPQTGLSQADIVFEILAEGMITRFLAFYQSEMPDTIGPVRSAREYYVELANGYDALYMYHGAADFINELIVNKGIEFLNGSTYDNDGRLFKRDTTRKAPHNSYLLVDGIDKIAESKGYKLTDDSKPLEYLTRNQITELSGEPANHVEIVYSAKPMEIVEFEYDVSSETYRRYNDREQTVERETGEPIQVDNVFIVEAYHEVIDDAGRRSIDFKSGGNAYLLQKGKQQKVQWENRDGRIVPVLNNQLIGFVPGKTWINVVPTNPGIQQSITISN